MKKVLTPQGKEHNQFLRALALIAGLGLFFQAQAQPFIVSTVPDSAATGVSPSAPVVFTFSEAMDTTNTSVQFLLPSPLAFLPTSNAWSLGNTVLTCTPTPPFPPNHTIFWNVRGQNPAGDPLSGTTSDFFSTSSGAPVATLVMTNGAWSGGMFSVDVLAPATQTITIEYSSTLQSNSWTSMLTTNTPAGGHVHVSDPRSTTNRYLLYRARTGS